MILSYLILEPQLSTKVVPPTAVNLSINFYVLSKLLCCQHFHLTEAIPSRLGFFDTKRHIYKE